MRFLRLKDLIEHTGMSKSYLYQKIANGEFPLL
jgi:predicted DNA-binding transcriptional regulator AlpA